MAEIRMKRAYHMNSEKLTRGICLIIDINTADGFVTLNLDDDISYIQQMFGKHSLNFIIQRCINPTASELEAEFKKYKHIDHFNFDIFIAIIMATSNNTKSIYGSDGKAVDLQPLIEDFCECTTLMKKPKIFFIQTYIGESPSEMAACEQITINQGFKDVLILCIAHSSGKKLKTTFFRELRQAISDSANTKLLVEILDFAQRKVEHHQGITNSSYENLKFYRFVTLQNALQIPMKKYPVHKQTVADRQSHQIPYPFVNFIRGYCMIINNLGTMADYDSTKLKEVFQNDLGFHCQLYNNLSTEAIFQLLTAIGSINHSQHDAFIFTLFCAEGTKNGIVKGSDNNEISMEELEEKLNYENCPTLSSRPKVFIYNTKKFDNSQEGPQRQRKEEKLEFVSSDSDAILSNTQIPDVFRVICGVEEIDDNKIKERFVYCFAEAIRSVTTDEDRKTLNLILQSIGADLHEPIHGRQLLLPKCGERTAEENRAVIAAEIVMAHAIWDPIREKAIKALADKKEELVRVVRDVRIARVAGAGAGIVGGILAVVGFGLFPVTLGGSLVVSGVGAGIAAAGGVTSIGATITNKVIERAGLRDANELLAVNSQLSQIMQSLFREIEDEAERMAIERPGASKEDVIFGFLRAGEVLLRGGSVGAKGAAVGVQIAGIGGIGALEGGIFAARIAAGAVGGVAIAGGVLNALLLPINIIELGVAARNLAKKNKTKAIDELDGIISELDNNRQELSGYIMNNEQ